MYKVDNATAATTQPAIGPVGPNPNGYFREANPAQGQVATIVPADWLNTIQNELAYVVTQAGFTLNKAVQTQLYTAITALIAAATANATSQVVKTVTQNGHGFSENDWVYLNGSTWNLAIATSLAASFTPGIILEVQSTNVFKVLMLGHKPSGFSGLTTGQLYYLSTSQPGKMQTNRPNVQGQYIRPVLIADSATSGYVLSDSPIAYGSGGGGGDLLAENNLSDLDDIPTARDNLGLGSAALRSDDYFLTVAESADFVTNNELNDILDDNYYNKTSIDGFISDLNSDIDGVATDLSSFETTVASTYLTITNAAATYATQSALTTGLADKQAVNALLTSISSLSMVANKIIYGVGANAVAIADITAYGRSLIAASDAAAARILLGVTNKATLTANATLAVNTDYICTSGGTLTLTLPATCAVGDKIFVKGSGATGWIITPNSGQTIYLYNQPGLTGALGTLISYDARDSVELVCTVANTTWETTGRGNGFPGITTA